MLDGLSVNLYKHPHGSQKTLPDDTDEDIDDPQATTMKFSIVLSVNSC